YSASYTSYYHICTPPQDIRELFCAAARLHYCPYVLPAAEASAGRRSEPFNPGLAKRKKRANPGGFALAVRLLNKRYI
ncbi:hypothetical protein, partial [Phascolarctobacterium faecium]|uniref:hypothetical protein n=1 Tax=Phascolarctobacterium faecium TaxID=33025 RepID=UPI003AF1D7DB